MTKTCNHEFISVCDWGYDVQCTKCLNYFSMEKVNDYINTLRERIIQLEKDNNRIRYKSILPLQQGF